MSGPRQSNGTRPVSGPLRRGRDGLLALVAALTGLAGAALLPGGCSAPSAPDSRAPADARAIVVRAPSGAEVRPFAAAATEGLRALLFVFVLPDCPISNVYSRELVRIRDAYAAQGVRCFLVYPDPDLEEDVMRNHLADYGITLEALHDPEQRLVAHTGATITPEAAVVSPAGEVLYLGRIDDLYVDFGKRRAEARERDLRDALDAVLAGRRPDPARTDAIGCFIPRPEEVGR